MSPTTFTPATFSDPLTVFSYAAESYDATTLLALASLQGGDTDGATIKENLQSVSEGGTKCESFTDCAKLIAEREHCHAEKANDQAKPLARCCLGAKERAEHRAPDGQHSADDGDHTGADA